MREYLFLKRHSLDWWRQVAESTHASQYRRLLKESDSQRDCLPPPEHLSDSITYIGTAVLNLALAYLLSGQERYVDTARRWIKTAISYPHWGKERMRDHDLDAAWLLFGLGLGYDWLKDALPNVALLAPTRKNRLQEQIRSHLGVAAIYAVLLLGAVLVFTPSPGRSRPHSKPSSRRWHIRPAGHPIPSSGRITPTR